jgi:hypothetical protein
MNEICKNFATPLKDQTHKSWALKEKCKLKAQETFNEVIAENFPNLKKEMPTQIQEAFRTPNQKDQNRISPWHNIVKTLSAENKKEY